MKVYQKSSLVNGHTIVLQKFLDSINKTIDDYQEQGFQVEIHYSTNSNSDCSALILAYTEE